MPRIAGVTIPDDKPIHVALTAIYGIGRSKASQIVQDARVDSVKRSKDLTPDEVNKIRARIEGKEKVEGELRREKQANIKLLKELGTYRGIRHSKKLPARGQRTRVNSRTVRGNVRKTITSGKRKVTKK